MSDFFDGVDFLIGNQYPVIEKEWMKDKEFILVTPDNLDECMDECIQSGKYAIDLETTGLDNRVSNGRTIDSIVGVCLSPDGVRGYYVPLGHVKVDHLGNRTSHPCNIPITVFDRSFRRLIEATGNKETIAIFHNGKFDQEFLQFHGGEPWGLWDKPTIWDDTMILAYLRNSRERDKRLKTLSKKHLDIEQIKIDELFPEDHKGPKDFSILDPEDLSVLRYGGGDAICTFLLRDVLMPAVTNPDSDGKTQELIYKIEKGCVAATRWMERNRIHIDRNKVLELIKIGQQEWYDSIMEVYTEAERVLGRSVMPGHYRALQTFFVADDPKNFLPRLLEKAKAEAKARYSDPQGKITGRAGKQWPPIYDVNSPKQLGVMFDEMGVPGLKRTEKSGQVKTSKDEIKRVIESTGGQFPFMAKIQRFREVQKALSNYLYPMYLDSDHSDDTIRINFQGHKVDTGRFSTPSKSTARGRLEGWPQINFQSIPSTYDPNRPVSMARLRECISARPSPRNVPRYICAIDSSGVELRIVTNLSREPKWLDEFFHCASCDRVFPKGDGSKTPEPPPPRCSSCGSDKIGDLHTLTTLAIYGSEARDRDDWKALRGKGKAVNFALGYGGGGKAVQRATGVDKNEGYRIKAQFDRTYQGLRQWWTNQHEFARKHEFVRTAFGRKYPVPDINHEIRTFQAKAQRNSINGPVQGSSADLIKIAMLFIYKECKKRGWLDKCAMIVTMHDELVFDIEADILEEAISMILDVMTKNAFLEAIRWPVPLPCDVEIGHHWMVPWDLNEMRHGEVRFIGNKKIKEEKDVPEGKTWEDLPSWPDELKPWFSEAGRKIEPPSGGGSEPSPTEPETTPLPKENKTPPNGKYCYTLRVPLTIGLIPKLAKVIIICEGTGTRDLRLFSREGDELVGWKEQLGMDSMHISPSHFEALALKEGF